MTVLLEKFRNLTLAHAIVIVACIAAATVAIVTDKTDAFLTVAGALGGAAGVLGTLMRGPAAKEGP